MTQKKKIIIVCDEKSNISALAELSTPAFPAAEYDITFIYLFYQPQADQSHGNVKYIYLNARHKPLRRLYAIWHIARLCRRIQPHLVITHGYKPFALTSVAMVRMDTKKVAVFHGLQIFKRKIRGYFARVFARDWHIVGVSQATCNSMKTYLHYEAARYHVICNAIDVGAIEQALLSRTQARTQLNLAANAFVFGMIARIVPSKGHMDLINAFNQLALPDTQLVIIGDGRSRQMLEAYVATLPVRQQIIFTGHKENAAQYMRALDVFVLPSLSEAFGMVLLEAMTARVPIIATQTGGIEEVLGDPHAIVPCADAGALAQKMRYFHALSAEARAQKGEALYQRLQAHFTPKAYYDSYRRLYRELCGQTPQ